jgi:phosphoesterase RecJ-like protein
MSLEKYAQLLREHDNIRIVTHLRPDGDTLGSSAALCNALRRIGKTAYLYNNPQITENYMRFVESYIEPSGFAPDYTVSVDLADTGLFPMGFSGDVQLCFDHHGSNTGYADETIVWKDKASCGELILELIKTLCGDVSKEEADLLYIAVSTDTGCFVYGNTTAETHRAAAELIELGASHQWLNRELFRMTSAARLKLEGLIFSDIRSYHDGKVNFAVVTLDMMKRAGATENDCDDLASIPGRIRGSRVSVTIREMDNGKSKVSVRSGEEVNSNLVCAEFGGGGHAMAAGCTLDCGVDEAEKRILEAIDKQWR